MGMAAPGVSAAYNQRFRPTFYGRMGRQPGSVFHSGAAAAASSSASRTGTAKAAVDPDEVEIIDLDETND